MLATLLTPPYRRVPSTVASSSDAVNSASPLRGELSPVPCRSLREDGAEACGQGPSEQRCWPPSNPTQNKESDMPFSSRCSRRTVAAVGRAGCRSLDHQQLRLTHESRSALL